VLIEALKAIELAMAEIAFKPISVPGPIGNRVLARSIPLK